MWSAAVTALWSIATDLRNARILSLCTGLNPAGCTSGSRWAAPCRTAISLSLTREDIWCLPESRVRSVLRGRRQAENTGIIRKKQRKYLRNSENSQTGTLKSLNPIGKLQKPQRRTIRTLHYGKNVKESMSQHGHPHGETEDRAGIWSVL